IADDDVDALVDVFETQAYHIEVGETVPKAVKDVLQARFAATDWTRRGNRSSFEVTITDEESLYDVLDILQDADLTLTDVDGRDPDLEDVFLEVTGNGGVDQ
ncbi:MAG: ABC transporter ATP-binding protein, partial [Halobacteriaceae archaeon]